MLKKLQKKWKVSGLQAFWILCVFAITGTLAVWVSKTIMTLLGFNDSTYWLWKLLVRIAGSVFSYQIILLGVAFLFGQFHFFWEYEKKMLRRLGIFKKVGVGGSKLDVTENTNSSFLVSNNGHPGISNRTGQAGRQQGTTNQPLQTSNIEPPTANLQHPTSNFQHQTSNIHLAIFASGAGSNAQQIINYFKKHPFVKVCLVVCNKPQAGVVRIAEKENIPVVLIEKQRFFWGDGYVPQLQKAGINFIVLAGFLWKIPQSLIAAYPKCIINIHPALLPGYGGKGMYGTEVHQAVLAAAEKESGITIHYVDEHYDNGDIIFQAKCAVLADDTPQSLAQRVHELEHRHFPKVIEDLLIPVAGTSRNGS